jgi:FtsP/CotA-like multicopper oxidase with cupredoxin domain
LEFRRAGRPGLGFGGEDSPEPSWFGASQRLIRRCRRIAWIALLGCAVQASAARAGASPEPSPAAFPFDFTDRSYRDHGVDALRLADRLEARPDTTARGPSPAPDRRPVRALETRGGYDAAGTSVYFVARASLGAEGFTHDAAGDRARTIADRSAVFLFPRRAARSEDLAFSGLRQDVLFDTTDGAMEENPLGLHRAVFVRFTPKAVTAAGLAKLGEIQQRNGTDLDGTPILKHVSEVTELERWGFVTWVRRSEDGSQGPAWVVWPVVADPRRDRLAPDSYLEVISRADGAAVDQEIEQNFACLVRTGDFLIRPMPRLPPFVQPLPVPPVLEARDGLRPPAEASRHQGFADHPPSRFFELPERAFHHRFHPDLPPSVLWGYGGSFPGPTLRVRLDESFVLRAVNDLSVSDNSGFGQPWTVCRLEFVPLASESAGFPLDFCPPGEYRDHHAVPDRGALGRGDSPVTGWYHDGRLGFGAQNTYKGLAGFVIGTDSFDTGNENDPDPRAWRLPSGPCDVPLLLADKDFDATLHHALVWNSFDLGESARAYDSVNGAVQPYFRVARRKYRFRLLNAGPSRAYSLRLSNGRAFIQLAVNGELLEAPHESAVLPLAAAQERDVVVDFSAIPLGSEVYLEDGERPRALREPFDGALPVPARRLLKFIVDHDAPDPSRVPNRLKSRPPPQVPPDLPVRTYSIKNDRSSWTVNGRPIDLDRVDARVKRASSEIWIVKNESSDAVHPLEIRQATQRILSRNGRPVEAPGTGTGSAELSPGDEVRMLVRFGEFTGRYVFHCSNASHEDLGLMIRWDVEP